MNDQTTTADSSIDGGASSSVMMTNYELASAIAYAFDCCDQRYVGGYSTSTTEPGKVMLEHLKELLEVQRGRAEMVTIFNACGEPGLTESGKD